MSNATFTTEPFTCPSCINKIESAVGKLPGVNSVDVGFNSSRVKVDYDESAQQPEGIAKVITELGYPVLKTKLS